MIPQDAKWPEFFEYEVFGTQGELQLARPRINEVLQVVRDSETDPMLLMYSPVPCGWINGFRHSDDATDSAHDVTIQHGLAKDSSELRTIVLQSSIIKQLDAAWAEGTNAGGLDTGTIAASSAYASYAILNETNGHVDVIFSLDATTPTLPTGWTRYRRIGAVITDASANIIPFAQWMDEFRPRTPISNRAISAIPSTDRFSVTVSAPPGTLGRFLIHGDNLGSTADYYLWVASYNRPNVAPSASDYTMYLRNPADKMAFVVDLLVNGDRCIYARGTSTDIAFGVFTLGWYDGRGRNI